MLTADALNTYQIKCVELASALEQGRKEYVQSLAVNSSRFYGEVNSMMGRNVDHCHPLPSVTGLAEDFSNFFHNKVESV